MDIFLTLWFTVVFSKHIELEICIYLVIIYYHTWGPFDIAAVASSLEAVLEDVVRFLLQHQMLCAHRSQTHQSVL